MGMKARDMTEQWWQERDKLLQKILTANKKRKEYRDYYLQGDGSIGMEWLDPTKGFKSGRVLSQTEWNADV